MPVKLQLAAQAPLALSSDLLALAVPPGATVKQEPLASLDKALSGGLGKLIAREEFKGQKDQQLEVPAIGGNFSKILLLGTGARGQLANADLRVLSAKAARAANAAKATSLVLGFADGLAPDKVRYAAEGIVLGSYRFDKYLTGERRPKAELKTATLALGAKARLGKSHSAALEAGEGVARAVCLTRDLVNEPPNELYPARLATEAQKMAKTANLRCQVFDRKEIEKRGMKLLIAVGQGSVNEPRFVHLTYTPKKKAKKRLVFVGKGLTFDSGGLCIKTAAGMGEMKSDMSGAANVVGLLAACAVVKPDVEVHGIIASAENMPDGNAYRPGDVFGSLDGKTVEIINTDAEGRLVLADALAYARTLEPDLIVDNATLTGACVVALGKTCSGFYATTDRLAGQYANAAKEAGEQVWRMPLLDDLKDQLKSDIADLKHTGDRWGGSITAALFLREFTGDNDWIHADIAGPALSERATALHPKGATGHGVLTFLRFVEQSGAR